MPLPRFSSVALAIIFLSILEFAVQEPKSSNQAQPAVQPGVVRFVDIARQAGLNALNVYGGDTHKEFIIETTGNGAVIFDYDNDGWLDVFLPNGSRVEGSQKGDTPINH